MISVTWSRNSLNSPCNWAFISDKALFSPADTRKVGVCHKRNRTKKGHAFLRAGMVLCHRLESLHKILDGSIRDNRNPDTSPMFAR